jgi:transposase
MDAIAVGIDVAKDRLDVCVRPSGESFVVDRSGAGFEALAERRPGRCVLFVTTQSPL